MWGIVYRRLVRVSRKRSPIVGPYSAVGHYDFMHGFVVVFLSTVVSARLTPIWIGGAFVFMVANYFRHISSIPIMGIPSILGFGFRQSFIIGVPHG